MPGLPTEQDAESVAVEIVTQVADREGMDPVDLDPPLHEVVDPDALEALVSDPADGTAREQVAVEFTYYGYRVLVDGGTVHVEDAGCADG